MDERDERIVVGEGAAARTIALRHRDGRAPGLVFLGGFMSDMTGSKAEALAAHAGATGRAMTRFDYSGHGASGGAFEDGTITRWLEEARAVFDRHVTESAVLIGSSMGGWIALLLARALAAAGDRRIAGLVLIAPATDMTEALMWSAMPEAARAELIETGAWRRPSAYSGTPYLITQGLIEDGRRHLFGDRPIEVGCPVHILQGVADTDVPYRHALDLVSRLHEDDVVLTLVKDGDHRLSRPEDLERILAAVDAITG
ncbi:alpha/beta hydrolase [Prosthecomicrobium pneumaticum]|uniref:Pimeloyl-ACP methyl ester carboxylesterase n=1 Tax=Prosthecomicrobium pneumaticum TaxID=81895 RepID=A0A7W9FLX8_9HYPH|nr:alpha/beta hydrolase [Prosthecomicrobium pneumaticum]MBB5753087.1 pimeloyl-ACP methyl ester carboxylesterase [Prosthecomicrobium pneumaticum]